VTRIFVLEPQAETWGSAIYGDQPYHYGRVIELPSGISHDLPGGLRDSANSKKPLVGKELREFLEGSFYKLGKKEPFWVVWEGRAILMPAKD
jgi:hypothetical protein